MQKHNQNLSKFSLPLGGSFFIAILQPEKKEIFLQGKHDCNVDLLPHFGYLKQAMLILRVNDRGKHTFLAWLPNTPVHQMSIDWWLQTLISPESVPRKTLCMRH